MIWAGDPDKLILENPAVPVWKVSGLSEGVEELWQRERLQTEQIEKCGAVLADVIAQGEARIAKETT